MHTATRTDLGTEFDSMCEVAPGGNGSGAEHCQNNDNNDHVAEGNNADGNVSAERCQDGNIHEDDEEFFYGMNGGVTPEDLRLPPTPPRAAVAEAAAVSCIPVVKTNFVAFAEAENVPSAIA